MSKKTSRPMNGAASQMSIQGIPAVSTPHESHQAWRDRLDRDYDREHPKARASQLAAGARVRAEKDQRHWRRVQAAIAAERAARGCET